MKKFTFLLLLLIGVSAFGQADPVFRSVSIAVDGATEMNGIPAGKLNNGQTLYRRDTRTIWIYDVNTWKDTGVGPDGVPPSGTDDQAISLVGNTLTLEDGGTVDLTPYLDNKNIASGVISGTDLVLTLTDASTVTIDVSTLSGGASYTAGNGLNLNTNEFSVDSTRVLLVSGVSPILGPWEFAAGTNAQLDALAAPVAPVKRFSFAIDGGVGYVSGSGSGTGDNLGNHTATQLLDMSGFDIDLATGDLLGINRAFVNGRVVIGAGDFFIGVGDGILGNRWRYRKDPASERFQFLRQNSASTNETDGGYTVHYQLNETGTPSDNIDLVPLGYANTNYGTTGDTGTSGVTLIGETSGSYTIGSQSWEWSKTGKTVTFKLFINAVDGTTPTGNLTLDLSGTTFPAMAPNQFFNVYITGTFSVGYYSILARYATSNRLVFPIQTSLDGNNSTLMADVDITTGYINISGSYLTN